MNRDLLEHRLLRLMRPRPEEGQARSDWRSEVPSHEQVDTLALEIARFQWRHNAPFRHYCKQLAIDIDQVTQADHIPPVPTDAFRRLALCCFDPKDAAVCFVSSGTTRHDRSRHYLRTTELAKAAIEEPFRYWMLPDRETIAMLSLMPPFEEASTSSLGFMLDFLVSRFGARSSGHFVRDGHLDVSRLLEVLDRLCAADEPAFLLGPSFSFVHLLDALDRPLSLPEGSRIFETGGFKGKSREVPRNELHRALHSALGIPEPAIVGEYGMSELSSQLYEPGLRVFLGVESRSETPPRVYCPPPWCRVRILEPSTLEPVPVGTVGLVGLIDLANLDSVALIVTGDAGRLVPESECAGWSPPTFCLLPEGTAGLELLGRFPGARPKGCSLAMDTLLGGAESSKR